MVDLVLRERLADAIHALAAGLMTNEEFEEFLLEVGHPLEFDPSCFSDAAIAPISESAWCLYSDLQTYRLRGWHRLSPKRRRDVLRWVLFLRSDLDYQWPPYRFVNPELLSLSGCLFGLLTLGITTRWESSRAFAEWQHHGEYAVWPFLRRADFEAVSQQNCPFSATIRS